MEQMTYTILHPGSEAAGASEDSMFFICCPACGSKVSQAGNGSKVRQFCPKCDAVLSVEVVGMTLAVSVQQVPARRQRKSKAAGASQN